ncbi:restriction system-associated AAA family ATPase [Pseudomonas petrae]|uniref:restriction system-associated AAA family ATPase n=1 Tax=Pseudomonas petrae TaxID=2912190 RepID=UPI001EEFD3F7|nr:restriction system-associated AAA family ATPase [Pseudomonas petrae]MCF7534117.1 restriction system-associated AAA family ATPase [Pseudomonas petrae]MCF7538033.1 restriction system-associated AAA family ATPase [Pseudomonas petrae]MCF7555396.1 restriction system-associated AAA family ATPase [Pseudomonas petrae]
MKLLRVHIITAKSCGGLLDGLDVRLRGSSTSVSDFEPLCLIGPNGAGKSQLIQVIAEAFQSLLHAAVPDEERAEGNENLLFEIEYLISEPKHDKPVHVRARRLAQGRKKAVVGLDRKVDGDWVECDLTSAATAALLPTKVVGYTSGANETLSLPFLVSRSGYAEEVGRRALNESTRADPVPDTRLMLIDYGTHLEVLVANLLLGALEERDALLSDARVQDLHSFRCVIQLAHSAAPKAAAKKGRNRRKGIQLTGELELYLDQLQRCATSFHYEPTSDSYTFDFFVTEETRKAFSSFWSSALALYAALHKLAMLNDLAIPKAARDRFKRETQLRKFASRLPEPQDEDKVFRFERVVFDAQGGRGTVDYVSLSDGEHQQAQLLGTMCMVSFPQALFLLDEPESHFNPKWRVKLISKVLDLPTATGRRKDASPASMQDCLLTTHSPFVPSDMAKERVLIFSKNSATGKIEVRHPNVETFGTTFDAILGECFDIRPPISDVPKAVIEELNASYDPKEIQERMQDLGDSVEKIMLADRVRQLQRQSGD